MSPEFGPLPPIAEHIWQSRYRLHDERGVPLDQTIDDTFGRVARAAAAVEPASARRSWEQRYCDAMGDFSVIPAGRILAGAGSGRNVTLFNCFVMGTLADDLGGIFASVREAALTMQQGGGIGQDFSTLRPKGALVRGAGVDAAGPLRFMDVWDTMCRTIRSAGMRRGAMMATLRCDHPDVEDFIAAKADPSRLRMFNVSVLVTDAFMAAVKSGADWPLMFNGTVYKTVKAPTLWDKLMRATYDYAEPGVIFIDRVNAENPLNYCETIAATNPCGEQPLPPYGACLLGSINLARLITAPFTPAAALDDDKLEARVAVAGRMLDAAIDIANYPLAAQAEEARAKRRIGLGITGLANALIFCGETYGSPAACALASQWMAKITRVAYQTSAALAAEKGAFQRFDRDAILNQPFIRRLDPDVQRDMARFGLRNGLLTSIAPTGTISLFAGNVSSGIEPVFDLSYQRRVLGAESARTERVEDFAYAVFRRRFGPDAPLPPAFVTAQTLEPEAHLAMQAALQPHVDSAISKTINVPEGFSFEAFRSIYARAHALGLKGCTTYRPNPITGAVLVAGGAGETANDPRSVPPALINGGAATTARTCPQCGRPDWHLEAGCWTCRACGYSQCS